MAEYTVPLGEQTTITLPAAESGYTWTGQGTTPPAGMTYKPSTTDVQRLEGTPTTAGTTTRTLNSDDGFGSGPPTLEVTVTVVAPAQIIPVPAAERTEDGYMLPAAEGVVWTVDGVDTEPGTYSVQPVTEPTTVTILPRPAEGYVFDAEPEPLVLTYEPAPDPDPDPDPEPGPWEPPARPEGDYPGPWPAPAGPEPTPDDAAVWASLMDDDPQAMFVAGRLSERIIRHAGMDIATLDPAEVLTARDHAMTVLEYVKGYTRDRGFIGYVPHRSLQAVIVAAGARLFVNPEQMTYYSTGDYSERPATMTGWTSAELGVLRRFRKVYA